MNEEEAIYKYLQTRRVDKFPLENEIFAIRNHDFHNLDYAIYVDGYISLDAIAKNIQKTIELENLLKERQADKERIEELEEKNTKINEMYVNRESSFIAEKLSIEQNSIPKSLIKEKFKNTRKEILSQTLIKVTDRYWMDKCLGYINNLEKELLEEDKSK